MSGRAVSCHSLGCVGRFVAGVLHETTGSAGSCRAVSSSEGLVHTVIVRVGVTVGPRMVRPTLSYENYDPKSYENYDSYEN